MYDTLDIIDNISDHMPVLLVLSGLSPLDTENADNVVNVVSRNKPLWSVASDVDIDKYKLLLDCYLNSIHVPVESLECCDFNCTNVEHYNALQLFFNDLVQCCIKATDNSIPMSKQRAKQHIMPGWNHELSIAREQSLFWHNIWKECDKPQAGQIVTIMRYTRNHYHDLIKKIKTDRNSAVKRSLGNALQSGHTRNFWSEIYKISKAKVKKLSVAVNDLCTDEDIANLFAEQYELLYNSVTSDPSRLLNIYNDIIVSINTVCMSDNYSCGTFNDHSISNDNVYNAIRSLQSGKSDGVDDIYSDNLKNASHHFIECIMYLFNSIMSHGCIPESFLFATILPLPKNSRLDLKNSNNYRAISLSSVFGKVFDKIIFEKQFEQLSTSGLQFGYKRNSSTVMCTTMLLETIEYYVSNGSAAFVLYIDAIKAFDRVCHSKLFKETLQVKSTKLSD